MGFDVRFVVPMAPYGSARLRATVRHVKGSRFARHPFEGSTPQAHVYNPPENDKFDTEFRAHVQHLFPAKPLHEAVRVDIVAVFPRPDNLPADAPRGLGFADDFRVSVQMDRVRRGVDMPEDRDNIDKAVLDALSAKKGSRPGFFWDDQCAVLGTIALLYAEAGAPPRTMVRVMTLEHARASDVLAALGFASAELKPPQEGEEQCKRRRR